MFKTLLLVVLGAAIVVRHEPQATMMPDLAVPAEHLRDGCALAAANSVRLDGTRVAAGLWLSLPIDTNPWTGTDRRVIATIRERIGGPVLTPDGPPLSRREVARYRLQLADGIEEGYAAIYHRPGADGLTALYALRFSSEEKAIEASAPRKSRPGLDPVRVGSVMIVVTGAGPCFDGVSRHVRSVAAR